jgi:hypothetical protein
MAQSNPKPGDPKHEELVKKSLAANLQSSVELLESLDIVEAREIDIGNSFLAFRFSAGKSKK